MIGDGALALVAEAPEAETLGRVQHVLGRRLERSGQRNELAVTWAGDADPGSGPTLPAPADHQRPGRH